MRSARIQGLWQAHKATWSKAQQPSRTTACKRRLPASAPPSLRLPGAPDAQRSASTLQTIKAS
jgi:hypothetical protein